MTSTLRSGGNFDFVDGGGSGREYPSYEEWLEKNPEIKKQKEAEERQRIEQEKLKKEQERLDEIKRQETEKRLVKIFRIIFVLVAIVAIVWLISTLI